MKRNDIITLAVLIGLLLALPYLDKAVFRKVWPGRPAQVSAVASNTLDASVKSAGIEPSLSDAGDAVPAATNASPAEAADQEPEQTAVLSNKLLGITLSSKGGSIA